MREALRRVGVAFAGYPRRAVLDGCPHCRGQVSVADHDLFSLALSLGGTVGTDADLKSLLPLLLERLVTGDELDADTVLGKLTLAGGWQTWPAGERDALRGYLDTVWRSILSRYPARCGGLRDASSFLIAARPLHEGVGRYLRIWDATPGAAPDRHLADLVIDWVGGSGIPDDAVAWARRPAVRDRLYAAVVRDLDAPWSGRLAQAYDFLAAL
ncbi:hypothetical protein GCM10023322_23060 [Rugosimonospora acidiphila]|uniref:Uncharacterized protein n=1 Tax=Rugosimonospora acidiphila TaxID=556531 RepID=A0ABP9RQF1_9ACTN